MRDMLLPLWSPDLNLSVKQQLLMFQPPLEIPDTQIPAKTHAMPVFLDLYEEETPPPCDQLPVARPVLPDSGLRLLLHRRPSRREAGFQSHRAAGHLRPAAHPQ